MKTLLARRRSRTLSAAASVFLLSASSSPSVVRSAFGQDHAVRPADGRRNRRAEEETHTHLLRRGGPSFETTSHERSEATATTNITNTDLVGFVVHAETDNDDGGGGGGGDDASTNNTTNADDPTSISAIADGSANAADAATTTTTGHNGPCRSIIAVGDTRLPSHYPARDLETAPDHVGGDDGLSENFVCELHDGTTIPISCTSDQLTEMRMALNNGTLISAVTTIGVMEEVEEDEDDLNNDMLIAGKPDLAGLVLDGGPPSFEFNHLAGVTLPPGTIQIQTDPHRRLRHERNLARYSGVKPMLVVRVTDVNGRAVAGDAKHVSNKFFGTYNDKETMLSQFASCSMNGMQVVYNQYGAKNQQIVEKLSAPGVLEVTIPVSLDNPQYVLRDAIAKQVQDTLGVRLPYSGFAHVLYVIEKCYQECGWAAYAYVNSWLSVYQNVYYSMPAVQMHELGHNLNLAHSGGLDGRTYTDHTCLMGNPLFSDDVGDMCFNPAKNYQIVMSGTGRPGKGNWYDQSRVETYDTARDGKSWSGRLVGIAEFDKIQNNSNDRIVLKLETGRSTDLYVGFNRATGINSDNKQGSDRVTIVESGGNGVTYSQSMLKATLVQGSKYRIGNWRNTKEELVLTVNSIQKSTSPWHADVEVTLGDGNARATPPPTPVPTRPPSPKPTPVPTKQPTSQPTPNPTTMQPSLEPSPDPTTKQPTPQPTPAPTTKQPTPQPTPISTTKRPTPQPTPAPRTKLPTPQPTNFPTPLPTPGPTPLPTPGPTDRPVTPPTTASATVELSTPSRKGAKQDDAMSLVFSVRARQNIVLTGMSIVAPTARGQVIVFVRDGPYNGREEDDDGWTQIYSGRIPDRRDRLFALDDFAGGGVPIAAGEVRSFYIFSRKGVMYTKSKRREGTVYGEDGSLAIMEGRAMRGLFRRPIKDTIARFAGVLRYRAQ